MTKYHQQSQATNNKRTITKVNISQKKDGSMSISKPNKKDGKK